jgi:hypothetical protein
VPHAVHYFPNTTGFLGGGESVVRTAPTAPAFNLREYFQPVFDELEELNRSLNSLREEENDRWKENEKKRKRNDSSQHCR